MNDFRSLDSVITAAQESVTEILSYFQYRELNPKIVIVTAGSAINLNACTEITVVHWKNNQKKHYGPITKKYNRQIEALQRYLSLHYANGNFDITLETIQDYVAEKCPFAAVVPISRITEIETLLAICYMNGDLGYYQFFDGNTLCWLMCHSC